MANSMIAKRAAFLLICLIISGCNLSSATSSQAVVTNSTATQAVQIAQASSTSQARLQNATATLLPPVQPTIVATAIPSPTVPAAPAVPNFSYPIGRSGQPLGDGFFIRHGVDVENTWYNPGYWHTGEDWYAIEGDTAGANVYAVATGTVVYAGANYPGRVVIIRHADDLYSMYGHLDPALNVRVNQQVGRGALLGTVLRRGDQTPNHLHFEVRTFLTTREVNGAAPRYGFRCGVNCPPGPGYWPIDAPDLPTDLGWRNPTHLLAHQMFSPAQSGSLGNVVVSTNPISSSVPLWSAPPNDPSSTSSATLELRPGTAYRLLAIYAGPDDSRETSARAYQLWYAIQLPDGRSGWVQAAVPSTFDTGSDGRPSSVSFNFFPALNADP